MHIHARSQAVSSNAASQGEQGPAKGNGHEAKKKAPGSLGVFAKILEGLARPSGSLALNASGSDFIQEETGSPAGLAQEAKAKKRLGAKEGAGRNRQAPALAAEEQGDAMKGRKKPPGAEPAAAAPEKIPAPASSPPSPAPPLPLSIIEKTPETQGHGLLKILRGKPAGSAQAAQAAAGAANAAEGAAPAPEGAETRGGLEEIGKKGGGLSRRSGGAAENPPEEAARRFAQGRMKEAGAAAEGPGAPEVPAAAALVKAEAPASGRAGGGERAKEKRRERAALEVRDFRSWENTPQEPVREAPLARGPEPLAKDAALTADAAQAGRAGERAPPEARPLRALEDMLAQELRQNLNGDIVRHAQIILRSSSQGTIRLTLRPETLGNVKIHLEMAENKVTGRIIVESSEALKAFDREIHGLEQAFKDSGFAGASLDTALSSGGRGDETERRPQGPFFSERFAAASYGGSEPAGFVEGGLFGSAAPQINMLA
ncbi:MAG: flagellar hook-length control protein FliK [Spirochaetaceae bacterium]|jgi:hypothetical protein|nr:flagellar hook-length control protein FliK [Spirochaetaceae bacterium]